MSDVLRKMLYIWMYVCMWQSCGLPAAQLREAVNPGQTETTLCVVLPHLLRVVPAAAGEEHKVS